MKKLMFILIATILLNSILTLSITISSLNSFPEIEQYLPVYILVIVLIVLLFNYKKLTKEEEKNDKE